MRKAQQSIEVIFILTVIFAIVFSIYLFMVSPWNNQSHEIRIYLDAKTMTEELCGKINQVNYMGEGYGTQLILPAMLGAEISYETTVYEDLIETTWNFGYGSHNRSYLCIIKVDSITFLDQEPPFVFNKTSLIIKSKDDVVVIE